MAFKGFAGPMGGYLSISDPETDWHITITTIEVSDSSSRNKLAAYDDTTITPDVLEHFIPNCAKSQWRQIDGNTLQPCLV